MKLYVLIALLIVNGLTIQTLAKEERNEKKGAEVEIKVGVDPASRIHNESADKNSAGQVETAAAMLVPRDGFQLTAQLVPCKDYNCHKQTTMGHFTQPPCETNESNAFIQACLRGDNSGDGGSSNSENNR